MISEESKDYDSSNYAIIYHQMYSPNDVSIE